MHTLNELTDAGLVRVMTAYRRDIEDGNAVESARRGLKIVRGVQLSRFCLKMRYEASEQGTDVYDHWYRLDKPPTYCLAAAIDHFRAQSGKSHVLTW